MFTTRSTLSLLVLALLSIQVVQALSFDHIWKRVPDPNPTHQNQRRAGERLRKIKGKPLQFKDTNAGKTINKGERPRNNVCKKWFNIRDVILRDVFGGSPPLGHGRELILIIWIGVCGDEARASVRLAFHDAGTYSELRKRLGRSNGGADGSMLSDPSEVLRADNNGLQDIVGKLKDLPKRFGVSHGDLLHVTGILGVIVCPGGPPVRTWIGRKEAKNKAPDGLLPDTHSPVPVLLARFADMGFSVRDTMALMGAHSTGRQRHVDAGTSGNTFDSTPEIWDVKVGTSFLFLPQTRS